MIKILIHFHLSKTNLLQIKDKTELMKSKRVYLTQNLLSIDWINNLVYYAIHNKIFIFNMTDRRYQYLAIEEVNYQYIVALGLYYRI